METILRLQIGNCNGKTAVTYSSFTSPLKMGTPNTRGDRLLLVFMMASPGVLKGDCFQYEITCESNTKALLTEQSYTKIFDTDGQGATRRVAIQLKDYASLFYCPSAVIPFAGSDYDSYTTIRLSKDSEFLCTDILAAGRVGMGETFQFIHYRNQICVMLEGRPVWLEHCYLRPQQMNLTGMVFMDGYTHQGTLYYYGKEEKQQKLLSYETVAPVMLARTSAAAGVCIRVLANTAQDIEEEFDQIKCLL